MSESTAVATVECLFCAETINARAKKCRHCGETLDVALRRAEEALRAASMNSNHVYMNSGGGGGAAAASASGGMAVHALRRWRHGWHFVLSILTLGLWIPIWIFLYAIRNRNVFF